MGLSRDSPLTLLIDGGSNGGAYFIISNHTRYHHSMWNDVSVQIIHADGV